MIYQENRTKEEEGSKSFEEIGVDEYFWNIIFIVDEYYSPLWFAFAFFLWFEF